jgi:hypothetical protein
MIEKTTNLIEKYNIRLDNGCHVYVDGANPAVIKALKAQVYDDTNYESEIKHLNTSHGSIYNDIKSLSDNMLVVPVAFSKYHKSMLARCKQFLEYQTGFVAINPERNNKLITALRTAVENGEGSLDKEATSHDDVFDAFRLSMLRWKRS